MVDPASTVIQFLSYEGSFTANGGPADTLVSVDIGVSEHRARRWDNLCNLLEPDRWPGIYLARQCCKHFRCRQHGPDFTSCASSESAPEVISTSPSDGSGGAALDANINVTFSEDVTLGASWFDINCSSSGNHSATTSGGPQSYALDPDFDFFDDEVTVTVFATEVSDVDSDDPPDNMAADEVFTFGTLVDSPIVINEVDADTAGSDALEFVELYDGGVGNTLLDGLVVVFYNGSDDASYAAFDLDGFSTDADGYFHLGNAAVVPTPSIIFSGLQNGADAVAVHAGDAVDFPNDTPVTGSRLIDALVYDTNDGDDSGLLSILTPGQPQQNEDGNSDRLATGTHAYPTAAHSWSRPATSSRRRPREPAMLSMPRSSRSRDPGSTSPLADAYVQTNDNVVTALDTNGFFMQTPVARSDGDAFTSDGIFCFTGGAPPVVVGDQVDVVAQAQEFFGMTELGDVRLLDIDSSGNVIPPVVVFDAATPSPTPMAIPDLERFEGMLVSFDGIATGPTNQFGETSVVVGSDRTFREPGIEFPGEPGFLLDGNPEVFEIDPNGLGGPDAEIFADQTVSAEGPLFFTSVISHPADEVRARPRPILPVGVRSRASVDSRSARSTCSVVRRHRRSAAYRLLGQTRNDSVVANIRAESEVGTLHSRCPGCPDILAVQRESGRDRSSAGSGS